jgi:chemotaxis protein histidine kinase CheA
MKYTIVIAALLGMIQAEEIYAAPVANATSAAEKKTEAKAKADASESDDDSSDVQEDSSDSDAQADSSSDVQEDSSSDSAAQEDSSSDSAVQEDSSDSDAQADSSSDVQEDSSDSDAQADSSTDLQINGADESSDHSGEFFEAREHGTGPLDKKYERVVPTNFADASDDLFMRSMIKTYALEGKNKDGSPNGQFFMDEATTRAASGEVLETHKGLSGGAKADYLKTYFPRTWAHFDVNKTGKLGVETMPQFMRFLASDQTLSL